MRKSAMTALIVLGTGVGAMGQAQAAGCLSGAAVGGLAGHAVHHGVIGAAGGCAVGHHMAKKQQRQQAAAAQSQGTDTSR